MSLENGRSAVENQKILTLLKNHFKELQSRFGIKSLAIFGSVARGTATDKSDIDVLVSFEKPATFNGFMEVKFYLEDLLGSKIDLVTEKALRPEIKDEIQRELINVA
jgi:predicted nucleotidyltransferase